MWTRANKILLNADKTKLVLFRSKKQNRKSTKNKYKLQNKWTKNKNTEQKNT